MSSTEIKTDPSELEEPVRAIEENNEEEKGKDVEKTEPPKSVGLKGKICDVWNYVHTSAKEIFAETYILCNKHI